LSLERNIISELEQGRIGLGNFQVGVSFEGRDTAEEVTSGAITKTRILFRPGK